MKDCNGGQPMGDVFFIPHTQFGNIDIADEATAHGLVLKRIVEMPSNNFVLVIQRG